MHVSRTVRGLLLSASIASSANAAGSWPGEALVAKNSIWLEAGGAATGDVAVTDAAPGAVLADSAELVVGAGATLDGSARANRVRVRLGGTVDGDVLTNALTNLGSVTGSVITPLALPLPLSVPELPAIAPGNSVLVQRFFH